jgi:hypothetical protein
MEVDRIFGARVKNRPSSFSEYGFTSLVSSGFGRASLSFDGMNIRLNLQSFRRFGGRYIPSTFDSAFASILSMSDRVDKAVAVSSSNFTCLKGVR